MSAVVHPELGFYTLAGAPESARDLVAEVVTAERLGLGWCFISERFNVKGVGTVRYCRRAGSKYIVGLEFIEDLHWSAPQEDVREPIALCDPASPRP